MPLADVEQGAKVRVLRFENEAEDLLHYLMDAGLTPGLEGTLSESGDDQVACRERRQALRGHPQRGRDRFRGRRPLAAPRVALPEQLVLAKER